MHTYLLNSVILSLIDPLFHGHHGFHVEWSWHGQFHMESMAIPPGFHMEFRHIHNGTHGQVHMESMEQMRMELMTITFTVSLLF